MTTKKQKVDKLVNEFLNKLDEAINTYNKQGKILYMKQFHIDYGLNISIMIYCLASSKKYIRLNTYVSFDENNNCRNEYGLKFTKDFWRRSKQLFSEMKKCKRHAKLSIEYYIREFIKNNKFDCVNDKIKEFLENDSKESLFFYK